MPALALAPTQKHSDALRSLATRATHRGSRHARLLTHRSCAFEDAAYVELHAFNRPELLPRWHQDDRGRQNASRGHHVAAPEGAYAPIEAWRGREHFLSVVVPVVLAQHPEGHRDTTGKVLVSHEQLRRYLRVRTGYVQDMRTGRRCVVRPSTIASVLGTTVGHVKKCARVARAYGLEVVVLEGRMLTFEECAAARRRGSRQRGLSTEVAFTIPRAIPRDLLRDTPTRGPVSNPHNSPSPSLLTAARGQKTDLASLGRHQQRRRRPRPPAGLNLVDRLQTLIPWLQGEQRGRCAAPLTRFAHAGWSAGDVHAALVDQAHRRGLDLHTLPPEKIRTRPAALLAALLRDLDPDTDRPMTEHDPWATTPPPEQDVTPPPAVRPEPCARTDCDGHGWIPHLAPTGDLIVTKCPDCPPALRAGEIDVPSDDDEPLF